MFNIISAAMLIARMSADAQLPQPLDPAEAQRMYEERALFRAEIASSVATGSLPL